MILVPVKNLATAKQRLAPVLDQPARTQLAQAMLTDVLETIATWKGRPAVSVVTSDPYALELAQRYDFGVIRDAVNQSETAAIEMATKVCGAEFTLVVPGDIPLIQSEELRKIIDAVPEEGTVLVPSSDRRGTNAVFRRPAGLFPLRFGNDSFRPHLSAASATGKPCIVLSLSGIALDVDTPDDLCQLASAPGDTRAQQLARRWGFAAALPLAANQ